MRFRENAFCSNKLVCAEREREGGRGERERDRQRERERGRGREGGRERERERERKRGANKKKIDLFDVLNVKGVIELVLLHEEEDTCM
jgi:hypothetical protein